MTFRGMRRALLLGLCFIVMITMGSAVASANEDREVTNGQVELGIYLGVFFPRDHELIGTVTTYRELNIAALDAGLRAAYFPFHFIGAEGELGMMPIGVRGGTNALVWTARGHGIIQYSFGAFTPHVLVGGGLLGVTSKATSLGGDKDPAFHWGLGGRYFLNPEWAIRLDGRHIYTAAFDGVLDQATTTSHFEILLGLSWAIIRGTDDPDGDGFSGSDDKCPDERGIGPDGCPPKDSDGDGIYDRNDKCPDKAGEKPDGCPPKDTDGDGVLDKDDKCPGEPANTADGCPVKDSDGDGILDPADKCPQQAEDKDGFEDTDGCPDPDNDGDGVVDAQDKCPVEKGVIENRGCPDADTDGDGVVDRMDNCPTEPGSKENQGCKKKQLVVIKKEKLEILDKVFFRSGRNSIRRRSHRLLNNVASVLKAHPEIKKIRIDGHTDSVGSERRNLKLSQKRAEAVMKYLIRKGVPKERLSAKGFGEDQPLETNASKAGRAANRRVEFNILGEETTETREMKVE